jgi:FeS assembly SUF system protein
MSNLAATEMTTPEAVSEAIALLGDKVIAQLRTVFDPEIPVNIYDLGLVYAVDIKPLPDGKADARIDMTLTTPNCPVAGEMPAMVQAAVLKLEEINDAQVNLIWDPPWDRSRMSEEAMLQLNMF